MNYSAIREPIEHGTFDFPLAYYAVDEHHPRYQMMLHWHPEQEILHVRRGRITLELDGKTMTVQTGDTVLIGGGVCHGGIPEDCIYECIVFDLSGLLGGGTRAARQLRPLLQREMTFLPRVPRGTELDGSINALFAAVRERQSGYELLVQGCLLLVMGQVLRWGLLRPMPVGHARHFRPVQEAIRYIETHYAEPITLQQLAQTSGLSRKYFCSFFRDVTSHTPIDYLNRYRMEIAAERILTEETPLSQIAGECGYTDAAYFSRLFRRYTGTTPSDYRRRAE